MVVFPIADKGARIRFAKGTYQGKNGWMNTGKGETKQQFNVIVILTPGGGEKKMRVMKGSAKLISEEDPSSYEEAMTRTPICGWTRW